MTVVLWRDCTGSGKTSDDVTDAQRAPADKAMGSEVKGLPCWLQTALWLCL